MTRQTARPPQMLTLVLVGALAVAAAAYHSLLSEFQWWFVVVGVTALVFAAMAVARRFSRFEWMPSLVGIVASVLVLTLFFVPGSALFGVFPTFDTVGAIAELATDGTESSATQGIPARAEAGIVFLLAAGFAVIAIVLDLLTFTARRPALTGIPLLLLIAVPSLIDTTIREPIFFVLIAVAYFALVLSLRTRKQRRLAVRISATAIVGSLVLSFLLPPVLADESVNLRSNGYTTGLNPFISLGQDLRRGDPITAIEYTSDSSEPLYFTYTVLKNFTGDSWEPVERIDGNPDVSNIGPAPGRTDDANTVEVTTDVTVGNAAGRWLPVPYSPVSIDGLDGTWEWNAETMVLWSTDSTMRGQTYTVTTEQGRPSAQDMYATGTSVPAGLDDYLELPSDLPDIVTDTAAEVAGELPSNYQKALALQDYFRSGNFTYSTEAPVDENDFDGSSSDVIAEFLRVKTGYCVHFASAFATMARTLGIPARIGVGFTSGAGNLDVAARETRYTVTTDDLHAWPELFFDGIGWVRFEPTVSRGTVPNYGILQTNQPIDPTGAASNSPSATPTSSTPTPTRSATPGVEDTPDAGDTGGAIQPVVRTTLTIIGIAALLVLLLLAPLLVRTARRARRFRLVRDGGSALEAWTEVRESAIDLGIEATDADTPRAFATELSARMRPEASEALYRLLGAVETLAFGPDESHRKVGPRDLRTVVVALRGFAPMRDRLRARFLPASVLGRIGRRHSDDEMH